MIGRFVFVDATILVITSRNFVVGSIAEAESLRLVVMRVWYSPRGFWMVPNYWRRKIPKMLKLCAPTILLCEAIKDTMRNESS